MELPGIEAVYPKPKLSQPGEGHRIYPYLLGGATVERLNQVWSTDITYIRMAQGFLYLVAVRDWFSRFVLSWSLSLTMEMDFCLEALDRALRRGRPEIFNSDQGSQFKVHPIQIAKWRKSALEQLPELFVDGRTRKGRNGEADSDALYEQIGRLKVELDWLKKKVGMLD